MSEKEKMQNEELEQVSGGGRGHGRVIDPGNRDRWPTIEYTCPKCGCKYTHNNPGGPLLGNSATRAMCPKCDFKKVQE